MAIRHFTLENLKDFSNGHPAAAFESLLKRAVTDCLERPGDDRARKVTLQVSLIPTPSQKGEPDGVTITVDSKCTVPDYRSNPVQMGVKGHGATRGQMFFNDLTDDVRQSSIEDADPNTGRVRREPGDL